MPDPAPLIQDIDSEERKWTVTTAGWLVAFVVVLVCSILFPIVIAAKSSLADSIVGDIGPWVPILALAAAAAAAFDQRIRTHDRWIGYGEDRDAARDLRSDIRTRPPADDAAMEAYLDKWKAIKRTHRSHRV
jgi:hypothetical protein